MTVPNGFQPATTSPSSRRADFDLRRRIAILEAGGGGGGTGGGSTILTGTGPPTSTTGSTGDFYIDTATDTMYGPKRPDGTWPVALEGGGGGGTGTDEVWIGPDDPIATNPTIELWYDTDAASTGGGGVSTVSYTHIQSAVSSVWSITHNLGWYPNVTVIDSAGTTVEGDVTQVNTNTMMISFSGAFTGVAYLS